MNFTTKYTMDIAYDERKWCQCEKSTGVKQAHHPPINTVYTNWHYHKSARHELSKEINQFGRITKLRQFINPTQWFLGELIKHILCVQTTVLCCVSTVHI